MVGSGFVRVAVSCGPYWSAGSAVPVTVCAGAIAATTRMTTNPSTLTVINAITSGRCGRGGFDIG
ncbi:hypothetical protein NSK11_contig00037-0035 [Nocardia seriolae]|uniref:Uncharacterized protein n=1 Tax=Nocardia seriolae TaxID=37332 RepID=A0ABC9YSQ2_9NOCA|nr:hypothetical protein NSK11_contig00037-0035 [Nocardia seriolae]